MNFLNFLIFLIGLINIVNGSRILIITATGSKSHKNFFMGIAEALVERGHEITIVSTYKGSKTVKNIRDIALEVDDLSTVANLIFTDGGKEKVIQQMITDSPTICTNALASKEIEALKKENFDLVMFSMFFQDCFAYLIDHFKAHSILMMSGGLFGPFFDIAGQVKFTSLCGSKIVEGTYPYSFWYRFKGTLVEFLLGSVFHHYTFPRMESLCKERGLCPADMPSIGQIYKNASLVMINSIKTLEYPPQPSLPHVINIGGIHCVPGKPLPKDLYEWAQGSGNDGFIFFSLGSVVKPSNLPEKYRKIFVNVFGSLKQKVLWKWDTTMDDLPPNVKLGKWLPQQDILAHPKIKLFITHGGLLSNFEATYHGVPLLGIPCYGDQHQNIREAVNDGYAETLQWEDLTEDSLRSKIEEIVANKQMKKIIDHRSIMMQDLPRSPKSDAVYWIEYVLRHDGAKHLRSPLHDISIITLYNIDVYATLILIELLIVVGIVYAVKRLIRMCSRGKPNKQADKKNKKKKA